MTLTLLVDEDLQAGRLVDALRFAGHDVRTVNDEGLQGHSDMAVLEHAAATGRAVLTRNCADFVSESERRKNQGLHHSGVLLVYMNPDSAKNLSYQDIVKALENIDYNVVNCGLNLLDSEIAVNAYDY